MRPPARIAALVAFALLVACRPEEEGETLLLDEAAPADTAAVAPYWDEGEPLTAEQLESGRLDPSWRAAPSIDSLLASLRTLDTGGMAPGGAPIHDAGIARPDSLDVPVRLPVGRDSDERSVTAVQVLLDRSPFSPGVIDGQWGKNTEKAVFWLQRSAGLEPTGQVDSTTFTWAHHLAGRPARLLVTHRLTSDDVAGPFVDLPGSVYDRAELDCLCYETLTEKLGERFHATPELLAELNPGVALETLVAGDTLVVPAVDGAPSDPADAIAAIVVSDQGHYLHAVDSAGTVLYHFPTTLGSKYDPSPTGDFAVRVIVHNPWFYWQPELLEGVPDTDPATRLPPGPNSPVGTVWIDLTMEHYGIHGTAEPASIGYATSSGCVRLTNWDAEYLADRISPGTPVRFRDVHEGAVATR